MGGGGGAGCSEKWGQTLPTEFSLGFLPARDVDLTLPDAVRVGEMSVFRGSISEYPGVVVDHFVSANCERGRFFFLSHCHRGLCVWVSSSPCSCTTSCLLGLTPLLLFMLHAHIMHGVCSS